MNPSRIYCTTPKKSYRVLYATSSSSESGIGYGPNIEAMRTIVNRWEEVHKGSASWAIQEGREGDWTTIISHCYSEKLIK
jgi:hypothetical protein